MDQERRKKRSHLYDRSLHYWLSAVAERKDIPGLVLADSEGIMLASSDGKYQSEEIAALAPMLAEPDKTGALPAQQSRIPVTIQEMVVDNAMLYLCALGEEELCELGLDEAAGGVRRILNTN